MSEQLNATIESEYEDPQQVNPAVSFHERMGIHLQSENFITDQTTPDSPTPPSEPQLDPEPKIYDINAELDCDDCSLKLMCNGEDESHFRWRRMLEGSIESGMEFVEFIDSEQGKAYEAAVKEEWQELVLETKFEELISTEIAPEEAEDILSKFESDEYSPYDPVEGQLVLGSDGNWELVIKGPDGKEYSPSTSKSKTEKDEQGNAGSKELLEEARDQLIEKGYFTYESEGLITVYVREGTTVLIYSYEKVQEEYELDDEDNQIRPLPDKAPTPNIGFEEEPTPFEKQNAAILKASGIGIKAEAHTANPQKKVVDKSEHNDGKHSSIKITNHEHSSLLKFLGIQRESGATNPSNEVADLFSSEYIEDFAATPAEVAQQTETVSAPEGREMAEEQAEQEADEEKAEETRSVSATFESSSVTTSTVTKENKTDNSNEASSSSSSRSDKVVAKETVRPSVAQEKSPAAVTQPETGGPNAPKGPNLEPQIQRNEDGTESVITFVKPIEQQTQIEHAQYMAEAPTADQRPLEKKQEAEVEQNDTALTMEEISQPHAESEQAESSDETVSQKETQIENIIAENKPSIEETPTNTAVEQAEGVVETTSDEEPTPTIEEIIAENRIQRNEQIVQQAEQVQRQPEAIQRDRTFSAPLTSSELNEAKAKIQRQAEKAQDALAALRQIRNAPRSTETLRQYQPGDQPAPIASTDATAQEREEELLQLAA